MPDKNKAVSFSEELAALLQKYDASLEAICSESSDMHGIHSMQLEAHVGRWDSRDRVSRILCDGWYLDAKSAVENL